MTQHEELKLKPCPFCGSKNLKIDCSGGSTCIVCYKCFSHGTDFDNRKWAYRGSEAEARAIEAWNKRT